MIGSKLVLLFKSLEQEELKKLKKYIKTPVFTNSPLVRKLFAYLYEYAPDFSDPEALVKEVVYKDVYSTEEFDKSKFSTLRSTLTKVIEDYLILLKHQADDLLRQKVLKEIYIERNIPSLFQKTTKELLTKLKEQPYQDADYFYNKYLLQRDLIFHISTPRQGKEITENIKAALDNLYQFYSIERLRLGLDLKNRERIYNESHEFELTDDLSTAFDKNVLYKILKEIFYLFKTDEEIFFSAKKLFVNNISLLNPEDSVNILLVLNNYAMQQIRKGAYKYKKEVFSLYKEGIKSKILLPNNTISGTTFINIVIASTSLKEFEYAEVFMKKYVLLLNKTIRKDIEKLSYGYYYFHKQDYQKATEILSTFSSSNLLYMLGARVLALSVHYEIFETDSSYSQVVISGCTAFKKYLEGKSEKIFHKKRESHVNFTVLLKKITRQKKLVLANKKPTQNLTALLNEYTNIVNRGWLKTIISRIK